MELWRYGHPIKRLDKRYRLESLLGHGGMADVCLAWDEKEKRRVAIKVIKEGCFDQELLDRFQKEASQVIGPHISQFAVAFFAKSLEEGICKVKLVYNSGIENSAKFSKTLRNVGYM